MRFFNTAGPVNCERHYCLPPLARLNLAEVDELIGQQKYFILHAPRQVGKTSALLALMDYLNQSGNVRCLYINLLILWCTPGGTTQRIVIECKMLHHSRQATIASGLEQTWHYMDSASAEEGHLILFSRSQIPWSERIFRQEETVQGKTIKVWGM